MTSRKAWSEGYVTLLLDMLLLILSHPSVNFDSQRSGENEFITFFICYMTLCNHMINRLCQFVDNKPALERTTLSSFLVRQSNFITKCDRMLLQSASGITKCDSYHKVRRNTGGVL